uniref:Uncharacterized protein n=1 Tax=Glycine max TaxID=3847 RepID=C6SYL8_SOYBN|nr:unknown [Glycine max]
MEVSWFYTFCSFLWIQPSQMCQWFKRNDMITEAHLLCYQIDLIEC